MTQKPSLLDHIKHLPRPLLIISIVGLLVLLGGAGAWLLYSEMPHTPPGTSYTMPEHPVLTPTPLQVPAISPHDPVSPLLFGTNMGLFNTNDQVLNSASTRAALQQMHLHIIRMPIRSTLSEATEILAAQTIKSLGATPLIILRGQLDQNVLADDIRIVHDMNAVFGQSIVYYEYGNEEDLQGVPVTSYTDSWNSVVPQLKSIAQHGHFIGPVNFQYDHDYLTSFLQHSQPRPDEISWHEYTCDDAAPTAMCISHIDHWTTHIANARATMISTLGTLIPIMITEWNYAPNAVYNDGKNDNSAFMNTWTTRAMQTLAANRIFASMQYSCTNTAIPLVGTDNAITQQGSIVQNQYQNIILDGKLPAPPATTQQATSAPTTTTTNGTQSNVSNGFTFADGGTDGWSAQSNAITLQNAAAPAMNGTRALQATIGPLSSGDYPSIAVSASALTTPPQAGQTLSADVYIASNSVSLTAKVFAVDTNFQWYSNALVPLVAGTWTHLTYTLPNTSNTSLRQIGIQFRSPPGSTISTDVYVSAVNIA